MKLESEAKGNPLTQTGPLKKNPIWDFNFKQVDFVQYKAFQRKHLSNFRNTYS